MLNLATRRARCWHAINFTIYVPQHIPWTATFIHQNDTIRTITDIGISIPYVVSVKKGKQQQMGATLEVNVVC